ncbi:hypothetical protein JK167_11605 [Levilactobacillus brevis]|uniref:DUF3037 domain-containing protein n=1 Tax=Levilactobacillus brevis TaxID=1580 RepID=A0AA41ERD2_LEVBR|nr:hypothetical protein [Levilactobacillus brevis]MBS0948328.1 hypothetical protein [Levilactobacillus brevis]MBS1011473.1 hypothetical protein [Levilactobacillus brevis]
MNTFKLFFTVLKYIPSPIRRESIIVGIACHIPHLKMSRFYQIKSMKRVASFDDEYDKDFFQLMMRSFHLELDYPTSTQDGNENLSLQSDITEDNVKSKAFLEDRTKYFANEFQFESVQIMDSNLVSYKQDIQDLIKTYLYYDRPKSERITTTEVRRLLSRQLHIIGIKSYERYPNVIGDFNNSSLFDYKLGDYYIKVISFDYSHGSTMAKELKSTLYDLSESIGTKGINKIRIVINNNYKESNFAAYITFRDKINQIISNTTAETNIDVVPLSEFVSSKF